MPMPLTSYIASASNLFDDAVWDCNNAWSDIGAAGAQLKAENFGAAGTYLQKASLDGGMLAMDSLHSRYGFHSYYLIDALEWIDANWPEYEPPEPYELTAKKICEAWAKNRFEDRALTIAFIDRMRQILWDEPFYVAFAARPEI